eukprot:87687_1
MSHSMSSSLSSAQYSASLNISHTTQQNAIAASMLKQIRETFGDSKWKLAIADGAFMNGMMQILASMQQQPITGSLVKIHGEYKVRTLMLWAKIYLLADREYRKIYQEYIENQQLTQQIIDTTNAREEEIKKQILQMVSNLAFTQSTLSTNSHIDLPCQPTLLNNDPLNSPTLKPTTTNPTTNNPTTNNPTTNNPTTNNPTTNKNNPTTNNPTTNNPTTNNPTTNNPTTNNQTTYNPTTNNPTTRNPTTPPPLYTPAPTTTTPPPANGCPSDKYIDLLLKVETSSPMYQKQCL